MRARLRVVLSVLLVALVAQVGATRTQLNSLAVEGVTMMLVDPERAAPFYRDGLSFAPVDTTTLSGPSVGHLIGVVGTRIQRVTMRLGHETIHLMEFCSPHGRPSPPTLQRRNGSTSLARALVERV